MLDEPHDTVFSGFVLRARPKDDTLDDRFKKYCFSTGSVRKQIVSQSTETTRALTNGRCLSIVMIARPPKTEQAAIATALSNADALITSLEKLIDKKRNIKLGTMQLLLTGKKRLPGFTGEWEVNKTEQFGTIITGSTPPTQTKEYWNGNIPWVTPTDISDKKDITTTEREISPLGWSVIRKLPCNSVLITCIASIGKNAILKKDGACNQQINAIVPNKDHSAGFLYYLMENSKQYLLSNAGITATNIISKKDFSKIIFTVPPTIHEQTAIADVLSDMDAEIEALEQKLVKYRLIKQGMMQELLTGKKRLI
jgi:type I restriction enzyme S subunit